MTIDYCINLWLAGNKEQGKTGTSTFRDGRRASSVLFEGDTIYSFGRHAPIARIKDRVSKLALLTEEEWSRTTAKHKSQINSRLFRANYTVIRVLDISEDSAGTAEYNFSYINRTLNESVQKWERARSMKDGWAGVLLSQWENAKVYTAYCQRFVDGFNKPDTLDVTFDRELTAKLATVLMSRGAA